MRAIVGFPEVLWRRRTVTASIAAVLVVLLVLAAAALGLRLPGFGFLEVFGDRTELDYESRYFSDFVPLREPFIDKSLGPTVRRRASASTQAPSALDTSPDNTQGTVEHVATNDSFFKAYVVPSAPMRLSRSSWNLR